jgi:hypothetical protein
MEPRTSTHPATQPRTHTTHTHTHPHQTKHRQTDRGTHGHTDTHTAWSRSRHWKYTQTVIQSHSHRATKPDARCQMPDEQIDRHQSDRQSHRHTDTETHTHTHTHTQPQSHPARQTYTGTHRHTTQNPEPDADRATRIYQSHRWTTQKKITQPEGTNVKHRKQIGCTHSSQKQSCTRKARTLTVTVDCR